MRLALRLAVPASGTATHVVVTADPETPLDDVARALNTVVPGELFLRGSRLSGDLRVGSSDLRDGDVVTVGAPDAGCPEGSSLHLAVVGGPASGPSWPLPVGPVVVGRSAGSGIQVPDPVMSRAHFRLTVAGAVTMIEDLGSTNGTMVDGVLIAQDPTPIGPGATITAGDSLLEVRLPPRRDADVRPDEMGGLAFNRPARIRPGSTETRVTMPKEPQEPERHSFPWVQIVAPVVLSGVAAVLFKHIEYMLFALMGPVLGVSSTLTNRRRDARRSRQATTRYATELAEAEARIADAAARELRQSRIEFPDAAALGATATAPGRRLWERRPHDVDAMALRVGVCNRPASVAITAQGGDRPPTPPQLRQVPVTVDLARVGVFGIAGPSPEVRGLARWLLVQLAVLRTPRDVQIVVLTEPGAGGDWHWVRWLPHARTDEPGAPHALIGNDRTTRDERIKELVKLLDARNALKREERAGTFTPAYVVVFDGIRALRSLPGVPRLLKEGPEVGIYAIGLDADISRLAEEGRAELVFHPPAVGTLEVDGSAPVAEILVDQVAAGWVDEVTRALAPIRDAGGEEGDSVIPGFVRYVELAGIDLDRTDDVRSRWMLGGRTTEALVGESIDGPFSLDLKRDGPHALVAGTTGAGKSEFLQTLVASLAVANRPSAINFVLIDYKGASAFADCERLPHTVGMVTNLDGHLTERALVSLDAELKRRELALKGLRASDIDGAWERDAEGAAAAGLARLVIVIDEFAELVHELPDFVTGLIRIARVGRSLGVHLILATQRPAGVVSAEMRANTGLRVALRMEDRNDSVEVLEAPDAATISRSTPGRGFVRTGGRAVLVEFQTARVAGRRKGAVENLPPPSVESVPWNRLGYPATGAAAVEEKTGSATDLHALVSLIAQAAGEMGFAPSPSPWLPALPATVSLPPAPPAADGVGAEPPPVVFGLEDLPALQSQRPAVFSLAPGGHLLVAGSARSGRSTALRTIAASIARSVPPSDLHVYGLDFGSGALLPLNDLPHCGGVTSRAEIERIDRLISRLIEEVARRQEILARSGLGDIAEQRRVVAPADRLPYIVVFLDRWEGFVSQFSVDSGSELPAATLRLIREGVGVGLTMVISGDRSLLTDRIASQVEDKLVLRLNDRNDYRMANINPRSVPEEMPPGRAFRGDAGTDLQIALLGDDPSGQAQAAALRKIGAEAAARWPLAGRPNRPFRVDVLPAAVPFSQAWALADPRPSSPLWALVGVGGDELTAFGVDLGSSTPGFVIAGPAKSGRSTALLSMAKSLTSSGATLVAFCPRPSPLASLAGSKGVLEVFQGRPTAGDVTAAIDGQDGPLVVVVDDAEAFARSEADDALKEILRSRSGGAGAQIALVVAGQVEEMKSEIRGVIVEARKSKAGLLLSPSSSFDGELVGIRLARNLTGRMPAGRGVLAVQGETTVVQVPVAD